MSNNKTIHSFWISGPLQPINLLTIKSFLYHHHDFILYAYDVSKITNQFILSVPFFNYGNVEFRIKDARDILQEDEIFYYKNMAGGNPNFKFGGIAERLKAEMLYQLGGWHVDLDVTCLSAFNSPPVLGGVPEGGGGKAVDTWPGMHQPYVLRPHNKQGVVANIIKAPKHSELARRYVEHTKTITADNRDWELSFKGLNQIVNDLQLQEFIAPKITLGDDGDWCWKAYLNSTDDKIAAAASNGMRGKIPPPEMKAIHWCNAMQAGYQPGSFLDSLFKKYNIPCPVAPTVNT